MRIGVMPGGSSDRLDLDALVAHARDLEARGFHTVMIARYGQMPSYRALLEKEGGDDPAQLALIGDEQEPDRGLAHLRNIGVSVFEASIACVEEGAEQRTLAYLESRL